MIRGGYAPRPPGVGEQQVFLITVLFSHEYCRGSLTHAFKSGYVLGTVKVFNDACATEEVARKATTRARVAMVSMEQAVINL